MTGRPSREAIREAGRVLAAARRTADAMTPRELAEAAWTPTTGCTVDELEDEIRADRGLPPRHAAKAS